MLGIYIWAISMVALFGFYRAFVGSAYQSWPMFFVKMVLISIVGAIGAGIIGGIFYTITSLTTLTNLLGFCVGIFFVFLGMRYLFKVEKKLARNIVLCYAGFSFLLQLFTGFVNYSFTPI